MRTTVDLPPALHRRVSALARSRGQSLSATLAELAARGLNQLNEPLTVSVDERSGFPVLHVGRRITSEDVAAALDDE
jgi:predicted transcriptional regulator